MAKTDFFLTILGCSNFVGFNKKCIKIKLKKLYYELAMRKDHLATAKNARH